MKINTKLVILTNKQLLLRRFLVADGGETAAAGVGGGFQAEVPAPIDAMAASRGGAAMKTVF